MTRYQAWCRSPLVLLCLLLTQCQGKTNEPGDMSAGGKADRATPPSFREPVRPLADVQRVPLPAVDPAALAAEDAAVTPAAPIAPRFAVPTAVALTPANSGTWDTLSDGTLLWRLRFASAGATSLNFGFTRYRMPPGGRLFVYDSGRWMVRGPFTDENNQAHGQLWTPVVSGSEAVIELAIPPEMKPYLDLELTAVGRGYRGFFEAHPNSGSCNIDVACADGDAWRKEIRSVAVIATGGQRFCSGFLVNDAAGDLKPYFMTAHHCGVDASAAPSLVVYWNYETSSCGGTPDGTLKQFSTGATFHATRTESDFDLVELNTPPDPAFNVHWSGWDATPADPTSVVGIHHPNVDEKRISFDNHAPVTAAYLGMDSPGDGTHLRIISWDKGTTEPGSSGSGLWNQDHRIVGQLHGGYAACGNTLSDYYGRFSVSYATGTTSDTQLKAWLDATGTGAMAIDGRDQCNRPNVDFTVSPNPANVGQPVQFASMVSGGTGPYTYSWDLDGDGKPDCTTATCVHSYTGPLEKNAQLTVVDATSCPAVRSHALVVVDPSCPQVSHDSADIPKAIPDNDPNGIASTLPLQAMGTVKTLKVSLNITHTYVGDLVVQLVSPTGTVFTLHNQEGGSNHDLVLTDVPVTGFEGQVAAGMWQLKVSDHSAQDTGTLNTWSLKLAACN